MLYKSILSCDGLVTDVEDFDKKFVYLIVHVYTDPSNILYFVLSSSHTLITETQWIFG